MNGCELHGAARAQDIPGGCCRIAKQISSQNGRADTGEELNFGCTTVGFVCLAR